MSGDTKKSCPCQNGAEAIAWAAENNLDVVLPDNNQLLLDIDNDTMELRPCPSCGREIEADFIVCPHCRTQFARRCHGCDRVLRLGWGVCPYCAEEVGHAPLGRATRTG